MKEIDDFVVIVSKRNFVNDLLTSKYVFGRITKIDGDVYYALGEDDKTYAALKYCMMSDGYRFLSVDEALSILNAERAYLEKKLVRIKDAEREFLKRIKNKNIK